MISKKLNLELSQVGEGTPGGNFLRQYWQPIAIARELEEKNPLTVTVLGEELALFRDMSGQLGLIDDQCAHRGASLSKGDHKIRTVRLDERGIRCCYHGWLYDADGQCLEMPTEPDQGKKYCKSIKVKAYPVEEKYGFIWAFMGVGAPPCIPPYDALSDELPVRILTKKTWHCNYLQLVENFADPAHTAILHDQTDVEAAFGEIPRVSSETTEHGLRVISYRSKYERRSEIIFPAAGRFVIPLPDLYTDALFWYLPVNDELTISYQIISPRDITSENKQEKLKKLEFFLYKNGIDCIDHSDPIGDQDSFAIESQGAIARRDLEHLGESDIAIVALRKLYLEAFNDVASGKKPRGIISDPTIKNIDFPYMQ